MLPPAHRLTAAASFREVTRRGRRASSATVVTHLLLADGPVGRPARVGLVVGKAVGGSVTRSRVQRRLRHLVAPQVAALGDDAILVVRALPASAFASSAVLGRDLVTCLTRSGVVRHEASA